MADVMQRLVQAVKTKTEEDMTKGKEKMNSGAKEIAVPPQPWSLRSKKRGCSSDEISETDNVQATLHHRDTEGNNTTVEATLLQCNQSPPQESTKIPTQKLEAAEQSCLSGQDPDTEEKHAEATNSYFKNVKTSEEQEETAVTNPNSDSQPKSFRKHADIDADHDKEELTVEKCNGPTPQTCAEQLQVFKSVSEEYDGRALEEELSSKENSQCNLEKKQKASQEECSNMYNANIKEITKEAGAPAKKKKRMGMCGLTERERSHFLQTQKRENGHTGTERAVRQICNKTDDHMVQEEVTTSLSTPAGSVTEQDEAARAHQSSHYGENGRTETACIAVTTSDGSCEGEGGAVPGSEQTGEPKSDPSAEDEEEELFGNQQQQELEGHRDEIVAEKPQKQMRQMEDGSTEVDQSPVIPFSPNPTEKSETGYAVEAALLRVNGVTGTKNKKEEDLTGEAGNSDVAEAGSSSTDSQSGGFNAVELCKAIETPRGSEGKDNCDADDAEPGSSPSAVNAEPSQSRDTTDPFGPEHLDYVSDSQLNTIFLNEEVMERKEGVGSTDRHEDATELICGLIRELSSLNRKVMATHRELDNLHRSSKSSRSTIR